MAHTLKLLRGDKRSPTRTLDLAEASGGNIYLQLEGFTPRAGAKNVVYSGQSIRFDGQERIDSSRDNAVFSVALNFVGDSGIELGWLARELNRFEDEVKLYEEEGKGEKIWLEYRWQEGLNAVSAPTLGQWSYYFHIKDLEALWPDDLHNKRLITGNITGVDLQLTCDPYAEGLDNQAFDADGLPDTDSDVTVQQTLTGSEFNGDFTFSTWIDHRASDYYVMEYYVDSNNWFNVFWDQSDSRFEAVRRISGSTTTQNGNSQSLSAGESVHIALIQDATTDTEMKLYVNGTEQTNFFSSQNAWANNGTLYLGSAKGSASGTTANTSGLDATRIWTSELTATNISDLYTAENTVKSNSNTIAPPPFFKTIGGDGVVGAVDNSVTSGNGINDNWGVVGWVPGDDKSKNKFTINAERSPGGTDEDTNEGTHWLGVQKTTTTFTPNDTLWVDFSGTADSGNSSGDAYNEKGYNGIFEAAITSPAAAKGQFTMFARMSQDAAITATPFIRLGKSDRIEFDDVSLSSDATMKLRKLGDVSINWPEEATTGALNVGVKTAVTTGTNDANEAVSYWELGEASGTRYDAIGSNDLTDGNTVTQVAGKVGNAAQFTEANDEYLTRTYANERDLIVGDGDFSVTAWIYLDTLPSVEGHSFAIMSKGEASYAWRLDINTGDTVIWRVGSKSRAASTPGALSTGTWYFIAAYHDATNDEIGVSVDDSTVNTLTMGTEKGPIDSTTYDFFMGGLSASGSTGLHHNGRIDAAGFFNKKLSTAEVTALYNTGSGRQPLGAVQVDFVHLLPKPSFKVDVHGGGEKKIGGNIIVEGHQAWTDDGTQHVNRNDFEGDEITFTPRHYNYLFYLGGDPDQEYDIVGKATITIDITPRYKLPGGLS